MVQFGLTCSLLMLWPAVIANIQLVGNGYEGIVVSISADVDVNPDLLTKLESILTEGSASLFGATKNQLYFKEIIFVLPENWPTENHYENALDAELDVADIIIDKPNAGQGHTPYVMTYTECGLGGLFMHLTPTYILDDTVREQYGSPGKVITHEWGHLRFGVFDEYAYTADEMFYRLGNTWYPTRCSSEVDGRFMNILTGEDCVLDTVTGVPDEYCKFLPFSDTSAVASIMYGQYLDSIVEFCDDANTAPDHLKHNKFADNRQNRRCQYRSVWEVMREHQDFISLSNQIALPADTDTRPQFRYLQAHSRKRVLVLDTSGSMSGDPLVGLRLAASNFILSTVETGSRLGIVSFATAASTLSPLREINSDSDREALVDVLPSDAGYLTSIGAGLLQGLQVLSETGLGGSLILITDGDENTYPYIEDVIPSILQAGVVVHSLAFGQYADPQIANVSELTGGRAFFHSGSENSPALLDALASTVNTGNSLASNKNISITILTEANTVTPGNPLLNTFYIDSTIGKDTTLTFSFTGSIEVHIESPDGPYNATNVIEHSNSGSSDKVLKVVLDNDLIPGLWSYNVTTDISEVSVLVNIQSKPRQEGQEVIQINSWLSQKEDVTFSSSATIGVFAEVTRGRTPVLNATVIATVETPSSSTFDLVLVDTGKGFDIVEADGVYSGRIIATDFSGNGRYNPRIKVVGAEQHTKVYVAATGTASRAGRPPLTDGVEPDVKTEPLEAFQRITLPGEIRLNSYQPLLEDSIAPARIVDFHAKMYDSTTGRVTLEWTAVGGDMDRGQAAAYTIYKSLEVDDIISKSTSVPTVREDHVWQGSLSSPLAAGQREEFIVFVQELATNEAETVYMSIAAVDEAGNQGEWSNLVIVSDARKVTLVLTTDTDSSDSDSSIDSKLIIGCAVAFVIAVIVVVVVVLMCKKSKAVVPTGP